MAPPASPKRRVRTESQLEQKRLADRTKHKENRKANKQALQRVENEVATIRRELQALSVYIRRMPIPLLPQAPMLLSEASVQHVQQPYPVSGRLLDCNCGTQHLDLFGHIDHCEITAMYRGRTVYGHGHDVDALGDMPRNPSLADMLLQTAYGSNSATFFITGFMKACPTKSVDQLLALYLIAYRYMRWLMKPSPDTLRDVPPWMLPTPIQQSHPHHPVVVDYLPWPSLRDYMCTTTSAGDTDMDERHSLLFYLESTRFLWSPDVPLIVQSAEGVPELSPEFEVAVGKLENWTMGAPWSDAFPHLMHLVQ
ncbi:hypothetical protein CC79DRAFT_1392357 [Sarocladium strictum]